jgi:peptide deformylase
MQLSAYQLNLLAPTNDLLNRVAAQVPRSEINSPYIQAVIDRMLMLAAGKGHSKKDTRQMVGLAAPQLGVSKRIILIDLAADGSNKRQQLQAFINPRITRCSNVRLPGREGCWSAGNICGNVRRAQTVTLEGLARTGTPVKLNLDGFAARVAQHETDHLDGIRFPDRIPAGQPDKLHWVEPAQFDDYRLSWPTWPVLCPRERWEALKASSVG